MRDHIVEKLRNHLSASVDTECAVVYLMAEVRKILEKTDSQPEPFALRMYCHWALHVDLDRWQTTRRFLLAVDSYVRNNVEGFEPDECFHFKNENDLLREFLYLDTFRKQLGNFLRSCDLPTRLCDEDASWFTFLAAYAGVIEDGTLSAKANDSLVAVERVVFYKGAARSFGNHVPFVVAWDIKLKDGRTLTVETEARSGLWLAGNRLH